MVKRFHPWLVPTPSWILLDGRPHSRLIDEIRRDVYNNTYTYDEMHPRRMFIVYTVQYNVLHLICKQTVVAMAGLHIPGIGAIRLGNKARRLLSSVCAPPPPPPT